MNESINQPHEEACAFGSQCQLVGVYTSASTVSAEQPCAVFLTAGLLHHIGPTRLHVELARGLAAQGICGLRFDLSGAGDSEPGSLGGDFRERSVREVQEAMNFLEQQYGHRRFVLVGLCSGADDSLATALQDERVAGIALLNGYAYPAGRFMLYRLLRFYLPRMFMWQKLRNRAVALLYRLNPSRGGFESLPVDPASSSDQQALTALDEDYRHIPAQQETAAMLQSLADAGTHMLFIQTGSEHDTYTYEGQMKAMFPALANSPFLHERYIPEADHTLILQEDRDSVCNWISDWFRQSQFARSR